MQRNIFWHHWQSLRSSLAWICLATYLYREPSLGSEPLFSCWTCVFPSPKFLAHDTDASEHAPTSPTMFSASSAQDEKNKYLSLVRRPKTNKRQLFVTKSTTKKTSCPKIVKRQLLVFALCKRQRFVPNVFQDINKSYKRHFCCHSMRFQNCLKTLR